MYLGLKTGEPTALLRLVNDQGEVVHQQDWLAERRLAQELPTKLVDFLAEKQLIWSDLDGVIVFRGPGSFTGLRIGITVLNTIADGLGLPIVGTTGDDWLMTGYGALQAGDDHKIVLPEYGAPARITPAKK